MELFSSESRDFINKILDFCFFAELLRLRLVCKSFQNLLNARFLFVAKYKISSIIDYQDFLQLCGRITENQKSMVKADLDLTYAFPMVMIQIR